MEKIAAIIKDGTYDNILFALNFLAVAASAGVKIRILFLSWASVKLRMDKVEEVDLPKEYADKREWFAEKVRERGFPGIRRMLQEIKELSDAKFYVCRLTSDIWDLNEETLVPEVDGIMGVLEFLLDEMEDADVVLTF